MITIGLNITCEQLVMFNPYYYLLYYIYIKNINININIILYYIILYYIILYL